MGTEETKDTDNTKETSGSKEKNIFSKLKEVTEFLSNLAPVLGAVYTSMIVFLQNRYCQDAENFYKIDSIHFLTDNIQRVLLPLFINNIIIIIYLIFIFNFKCYLRKGRKINKDYVLNCFINIIASGMFMVGVRLSSLPFYLEVILFFLALFILIMECICLIVCFLKQLSKVKDCIQNKFECNLIKENKIKQVSVSNCFMNIITTIISMFGPWTGYIKAILFALASVILIMESICNIEFFYFIIYFLIEIITKAKNCIQNQFKCNLILEINNKVKDCIQNDLFIDIRDFLCFIFLVLAGVFIVWSVIVWSVLDNNRFFQTRKYEIIYDVNTDFDSNKLDVEVVILHKGSQIITKKGKIVYDTLYIDNFSYEIKEFSQYKYILRGFTEVDNNHNLQKILLSKGIDSRKRDISFQKEYKIAQSKFHCYIYGGICFGN